MFSLTYKYVLKYTLFLLCLVFSAVSYSAVVEGLFSTALEVPSQQSVDRDAAFNEALTNVLLKVSGNRALVEQNELVSRFFPAEKYVVRFSYKENPRYSEFLKQTAVKKESAESPAEQTKTLNTISDSGETISRPPLPFLLDVDFSGKALEKAMIDFGMPIWGNVRPAMLLWVVLEEDGRRQLLGTQKTHFLTQDLANEAARFALPVAFPDADQADNSALDITHLWGLFPDALDQAKKRYTADGHLMLRVYKSLANTWNANWSMSLSGENYTSSVMDADLNAISETVISFMAGIMAERFSIQPGQVASGNQLDIEVTEVKTFKDFIDLQAFLEKLAPIKRVTINWVEGQTLSLSLELNSSTVQFYEYLNLSGRLIKLDPLEPVINSQHSVGLNKASPVEQGLPTEDQFASGAALSPRAERYKWLPSVPLIKPN